MQTSIRSTTDSTQHGDLPRTENNGGNSWKRLCSSLGLARDDDDDDELEIWIYKDWLGQRQKLGFQPRHSVDVFVITFGFS